jgi:hypothetical protein
MKTELEPEYNERVAELEAQLASARTECEEWRNRKDAAIIRAEEAEEREDAAEARAEAAETALADRIEHCKNHHSDVTNLRAALEMVEWVDVEGSQTGDMYCPLCKEWIWEGHEDDCLIGLALARQAVGPQIAQAALNPEPAESEVKK